MDRIVNLIGVGTYKLSSLWNRLGRREADRPDLAVRNGGLPKR